MKKSNKILLGGFLTLLLIFAAIHIALYAKYKAGDYTAYNAEDDLARLSMQQFPNIIFVSVHNVPGATIKFSEVAQVEKEAKGDLAYARKGDTLQITGTAGQNGSRRNATIYLPYNSTLSLHNSILYFTENKKAPQNSPVIYLQKSQVIFPDRQNPVTLSHLKLFASDSSLVFFGDNTEVAQLDLRLSNSSFEAAKSNFGQLSIVTDSLSQIALPTKQLLKATISTTAE
ncbi:MAG: hypothetical protein EOO14_00575 [Chitinophagaceae bacterium]|nr:MAG: hypothetical protein EOO14_00575 [Chitinophagaceae bacterium]